MNSNHRPCEYLIDVNNHIKLHGSLYGCELLQGLTNELVPSVTSKLKLVVDFNDRGAGFKFRALYEDWSIERLIKEMY